MSQILIVTPIYKIVGREDLVRDTECVHTLVKDWITKHDLYVVDLYTMPMRKIFRLCNLEKLSHYTKGYHYVCDNIPVTLIERQNFIPRQKEGHLFSSIRINNIIRRRLNQQNFHPDLVLVHIPSSSKFVLERFPYSCKKIAILHYSDVKYLEKHGNRFVRYLNQNFSKVFCRSQAIYEVFKSYPISNLQKEMILSGVKCDGKPNFRKNFSNSKKKILYVGKIIERKRLDYLIKALSRINCEKWELTVIGEGPMQKQMQDLANRLHLEDSIHFLGFLPQEKVFQYMEHSDIFCMPSVRETLGLVYIEAMSKGCVTIATKGEGIDGVIIDGYNGYLTESSVDAIYDVLYKILSDKEQHLLEISRNAIKTAYQLNEKDVSQKYLDLISEELQ